MAEYFGMATHSVPFPHWTTIAWQVALFVSRPPSLCLVSSRSVYSADRSCPSYLPQFVFEDMFHVSLAL